MLLSQSCSLAKSLQCNVILLNSCCIKSSQRCLHLIVAVGLVWSSNLKSYASCNIATGRVSQARQVKSEVPGKERHLACAMWRLGSGLTFQSHKTQACWENNTIKFTIWQMLRITTQVRLSGMEEAKIHNVLLCLWGRRRWWITSSRGNFVIMYVDSFCSVLTACVHYWNQQLHCHWISL